MLACFLSATRLWTMDYNRSRRVRSSRVCMAYFGRIRLCSGSACMKMAEKRPQQESESDVPAKIPRTDGADDSKLTAFLSWCKEHNLILNDKVRVGREGSCAQYGMVATDDIAEEECLFEIPRGLLLTPENCSISKILAEENSLIFSESGWVTLMLTLLHERINPDSKWRQYLDFVPDFKELKQPMFWASEEVENALQGTGIPAAVQKDLTNMEFEFKKIVLPFMKLHPRAFTPECHDFELYKKLVAFVMAYSFTEPKAPSKAAEEGKEDEEDDDEDDEDTEVPNMPMMVPMADMLNHVAKHNARLDYGEESLKMVAIKPIKKGEEIYNTYGQLPNWQLMQMYGFAEPYPKNHNDTVEIPMPLLLEAVLETGSAEDVADEKWSCMKDIGLVSADGMFVLGEDGILTEEELHSALKVFAMSGEEFVAFKENEGWLEEEAEKDDAQSLSFDGIPKLPDTWKDLLRRMADAKLIHIDSTLEKEEEILKSPTFSSRPHRERHSCYVRHGQLKTLKKLIEATKQ